MLLQNNCSIVKTNEADLLPGHAISEEGVALVWTRENGKAFVMESTGAPGEVFAGFAISRPIPPAFSTQIEEFVVGADGTFIFDRMPIADQIFVKIDGVTMVQESGGTAPDDKTSVTIDGAAMQIHADLIGKSAYVQYHYELSAMEARSITGDAPIGGLSGNIQGRCGFIEIGDVGTNMFDASVDWSDDSKLNPSLGAGGRLTIGGNGTKLTGIIIKEAPSADDASLVLTVKA